MKKNFGTAVKIRWSRLSSKTVRLVRRRFLRAVRLFVRSETGMTLPLLALSLTAMTGFVGTAIDVARLQMVQSKLQFSLDAAGLAAGSTVSTASLNSETSKYLITNFNGYMGAQISASSVTADDSNTVFTLAATATMPTTFMKVLGIDDVSLSASAQISRAVTGVELVLVLDNTGSMASSSGTIGVSKLAALKSAATTLVNSLFGSSSVSTNGKLWVGVVPFSQSVNVGSSRTAWTDSSYDYDGTAVADWGPTSWAGCVDARKNGKDVTDEPPSQGTPSSLFGQYYWTSDNLNTNGVSNSGTNKWKLPTYSKCVYSSKYCTWSGCATTCSTVTNCGSNYVTCAATGNYTYVSGLSTTTKGPNLYCPQEVTPLTNDSSIVLSAIDSMKAVGDTLVNQGLVWGWNMLSPRWRGLWGGTMDANGLPLDYSTPGMSKAVVLLSDGTNTIDNSAHGGYWFLGSGLVGTTSSSGAVTVLNNRTLSVCTAMKAQGVYIYTIALGTGLSTSAKNTLKNCATAVNYYFESPSTDQLEGVFKTIGDSLSNLRVSK